MLIARLEVDFLVYCKTDKKWFVVEKVDDMMVPQNVDDVKKGSIKTFVKSLIYFKIMNNP